MARASRLEVVHHSTMMRSYVVHSDASGSPVLDLIALAVLGWFLSRSSYLRWIGLVVAVLWLRSKMSVVLSESLQPLRSLGLQLSTTRGLVLRLPLPNSAPHRFPLSTSRDFLPMSSISDIVINEVIYGWEIRYVLVVIHKLEGSSLTKLRIGYEELMPRLNDLSKVWRGVRAVLFDELDEDEDGAEAQDAEGEPTIDELDRDS